MRVSLHEVTVVDDLLLRLWGKRTGDGDTHYPLLWHMLDSAAVVEELWHYALHAAARNFVAGQLRLPPEQALHWLCFWVGLHDIGKACPAFEGKSILARTLLAQRLPFYTTLTPNFHHGTATAAILGPLLHSCVVDRQVSRRIAVSVGAHHGLFPRTREIQELEDDYRLLGGSPWKDAQGKLFRQMQQACNLSQTDELGLEGLDDAFLMFLAGFASVADWIASNEAFFNYVASEPEDPYHHQVRARACASNAVKRLGWQGWQPPERTSSFSHLFPFVNTLRPLQRALVEVMPQLSNAPGMLIVEAPTGEGKTEAAMYAADCWLATNKQRGYYFALPTQATSNQMFQRVQDFLERRYSGSLVNLMLVHGSATLVPEFETMLRPELAALEPREVYGQEGYDGAQAHIVASEWFTFKKRGLLAPFGVGTIDQSLLAVLQTRHVFVRLYSLANKVVVFDEVHAYDAYMVTLLERLIQWLAALDCSVVLLSATLPTARKERLLQAYRQRSGQPISASEQSYPRISWVSANGHGCRHIEASPEASRALNLEWLQAGAEDANNASLVAEYLKARTVNGGCAAVICNTVARAQTMYRILKRYFPNQDAGDGSPELDLFHARYPFRERLRRETRTLHRFGKNSSRAINNSPRAGQAKRPRRAVLVATQVIEQSLDLDFDMMVTDIAPTDLLLQRSGRLWRHHRQNRPTATFGPTLCICGPDRRSGAAPDFGSHNEAVYDKHILLRSWLTLQNLDRIAVPQDVEELIEAVYDERDPPATLNGELQEVWLSTRDELQRKCQKYMFQGRRHSILPPEGPHDVLDDSNLELEEDNPEVHESLQALTRLSGPSLSVICLYGSEGDTYYDREGRCPVNSSEVQDRSTIRELLQCSLSVTGWVARQLIDELPTPPTWNRYALLRHHKLLVLGSDGSATIGSFKLRLDEEYGLLVTHDTG
ncbi:MAG: CRISPR-associated helicase Cas3' [bacterium]